MQSNIVYLESQHTKTRHRRSIPLNEPAWEAIFNRLRFRAEFCPDSRWVFCKHDGSRMMEPRRSFIRACKIAGIDDFRFHDMKHLFASWAVQAGVPMRTLQDLLGHRSIKSTKVYAHLAPENLRDAVILVSNEDAKSVSRKRHVDFVSTTGNGS